MPERDPFEGVDFDKLPDDPATFGQFYDVDGQPCGMRTWARLFHNPETKIVKQDDVGDMWLSTVYLGIDHGFGMAGAPLIYETALFENDDDLGHSLTQILDRYPTRAAALAGHDQALADIRERGIAALLDPEG